jgi:hypothetical protein
MKLVKRFAFWPLLAVACTVAGGFFGDPKDGSVPGSLVGLGVSVVLAALIDHRRGRGVPSS